MSVRKGLIAKIIMLVAILIFTSIIFFNSFEDIAASHNASDVIIDAIFSKQNEENNHLKLIVRKMAHLIEYAALGVAVMLFVQYVEKHHRRKMYSAALFLVLLISVLDEHIQSFSNRTSSTADILLDFLGALIGFAFVLAIRFICTKLKGRKEQGASAETDLDTEQK